MELFFISVSVCFCFIFFSPKDSLISDGFRSALIFSPRFLFVKQKRERVFVLFSSKSAGENNIPVFHRATPLHFLVLFASLNSHFSSCIFYFFHSSLLFDASSSSTVRNHLVRVSFEYQREASSSLPVCL